MTGLERGNDRLFDARRRDAFLVREVDVHHAVAVVEFQCAGGRDVGGVVKIDAEELPFGFEYADDAKLQIANRQARAKRVLRTKKLGLEFGAENHESAGVFRFFLRQELSAADFDAVHLGHFRCDAVDRRAAQSAIALDLGIAPDAGRHAGDVG